MNNMSFTRKEIEEISVFLECHPDIDYFDIIKTPTGIGSVLELKFKEGDKKTVIYDLTDYECW